VSRRLERGSRGRPFAVEEEKLLKVDEPDGATEGVEEG
jgi:hypothetical protein